ncbi:MAG: hypothetical protein ACKO21_10905 [Nodosilinea sp.]
MVVLLVMLGATGLMIDTIGLEMTEPLRQDVEAKRYLATTRSGYGELLSLASARNLELQVGLIDPEEVAAFQRQP